MSNLEASKCNSAIRSFNESVKEFHRNRSEELASNIHRHLQTLCASSDVAVFDPGRREVVDFFVNLYELLTSLDVYNPLVWSGINILQEAARNQSARNALTHTYKFSPILTRILATQLPTEKRLTILNLLQDLTFDIKISWQEAHLPLLISTLTKWISSEDHELIPVCLGVLVNLCYQNLPAIYTLMRAVDIKRFLKLILKLQRTNDNARIQVCKMLIILESVSGAVPDSEIETFIRATCPTIIDAIPSGNAFLIRHVVNFFKEIVKNEKATHVILGYPNWRKDIEKILAALEKEEELKMDCVTVILDFLCSVSSMKVRDLCFTYPQLLKLSLKWVHTSGVSTEALNLLSTITSQLCSEEEHSVPIPEREEIMSQVFELLHDQMPVILLLLDHGVHENVGSIESFNRLTALLQLLKEMIKVPVLVSKITSILNESMMKKLFEPLCWPDAKGDNDLFQQPVYTFYVQALCFLSELSDKETTRWLLLYSELLQQRQVLMVLAISLYMGSATIKRKVLSLTTTTGFSNDSMITLAGCMSELNKLVLFSPSGTTHENHTEQPCHISPMDINPLLTITQEGHLNNILDKYERAASKNESAMTSAMMELYQYKMAAMSQCLRQMQSSQEAADARATRLQHSLALTSSEVSRLHFLLHGAQQSLEASTKETSELGQQVKEIQQQANEAHLKYTQLNQSYQSKTRIISEQKGEIDKLNEVCEKRTAEVESLNKRLIEQDAEMKVKEQEINTLSGELKQARLNHKDLKGTIEGLEKSVEELKKQLLEDKKEMEAKTKKIEALKKEVVNQSTTITKLEKSMNEKEQSIVSLNKELKEANRMRELISEIAAGKRKL